MDSLIQISIVGISIFLALKILKGFFKFVFVLIAAAFLAMFLVSSGLLIL